MNIDTIKVELIDWITQLDDQQAIKKLLRFKKKFSAPEIKPDSKVYGSGKYLVEFISDDFNEPLDIFKGYEK